MTMKLKTGLPPGTLCEVASRGHPNTMEEVERNGAKESRSVSCKWIQEYEAHEPQEFKPKGNDMKWTDQGGGKEFAQAPAGTHEAICTGVIDLGTQTGSYQGQPTVKRQVLVQWELPNETMEDGKPFIVSKFYTASLNEKATLRHDLESWRGRAFTEQELAGFESKNILGKPCLLSVIHNDAGKARVASVMAIPKGMTLPHQVNPTTHFSLDSYDAAVFEKIGKGLQDMIRKSPEFQGIGKKGHFDDMPDDVPDEPSAPF